MSIPDNYLGRKVIRNRQDFLEAKLDPRDFQDYIIQNKVITPGEREILMAVGKCQQDRAQEFLKLLMKREDGYSKFKEILAAGKMYWISSDLDMEEARLRQLGEHIHILDRLPQEQRFAKLNDRQMYYVGDIIQFDWKEVGKLLGLTRNQLTQVEYSHKPPDQKATDILVIWQRNTTNPVNIDYLYRIMDRAGIDVTDEQIRDLFLEI